MFLQSYGKTLQKLLALLGIVGHAWTDTIMSRSEAGQLAKYKQMYHDFDQTFYFSFGKTPVFLSSYESLFLYLQMFKNMFKTKSLTHKWIA